MLDNKLRDEHVDVAKEISEGIERLIHDYLSKLSHDKREVVRGFSQYLMKVDFPREMREDSREGMGTHLYNIFDCPKILERQMNYLDLFH